jgi:uncharacterized protein (DUF4415 family)
MNAKTTTDTQTDWAKLARCDDSEIDYSDAPSIMPNVEQMRVRQPNGQVLPVSNTVVEVDADILAWFKARQSNYQATINQLLRNFMKEHEHDLA